MSEWKNIRTNPPPRHKHVEVAGWYIGTEQMYWWTDVAYRGWFYWCGKRANYHTHWRELPEPPMPTVSIAIETA